MQWHQRGEGANAGDRHDGRRGSDRIHARTIIKGKAKKSVQEIVDMPARRIDLFIRFCLQNNGRLFARKRASHFDILSDEEIARMEQAVQSAYGSPAAGTE
jgi:hypothetical protein